MFLYSRFNQYLTFYDHLQETSFLSATFWLMSILWHISCMQFIRTARVIKSIPCWDNTFFFCSRFFCVSFYAIEVSSPCQEGQKEMRVPSNNALRFHEFGTTSICSIITMTFLLRCKRYWQKPSLYQYYRIFSLLPIIKLAHN